MLNLPRRVTVVEVGPRDGLQSLRQWVPTSRKVAMIDRLSAAGFPVIEATSFAHPRAVPNLRDADAVMATIRRRPGTIYRALAPNARGAERAVDAGVDEVLGLLTVSETYSLKNQNMSVTQAIEQARLAFETVSRRGLRFVMGVGMAFACPYEGQVPESRLLDVVGAIYGYGIRSLYLADSAGMANPRQVNAAFRAIRDRWADLEILSG